MVSRAHYYFLASLPSLPPLGEPPPLSPAELYRAVQDSPELADVVAAVLLEQDLLERQTALAGVSREFEAAVFTQQQALGEAPLPPFGPELDPSGAEGDEAPSASPEEAVWAAYFRHVVRVGRRWSCAFLPRWADFEVALRNGLAAARARAMNLPPRPPAAASALVEPQTDPDVSGPVDAWLGAPTLLEAERRLDEARWDWVWEHAAWFSFQADEAAAYARRLVLLRKWESREA